MRFPSRLVWVLVVWLGAVPLARADRTFAPGSLIIPMDLSYQGTGMFQAYGLIYQLLRQGVHVYWMIDPDKTWHAAPCNTPGDLCAWDCAIEGSGVKCPYPTASPDFTVDDQRDLGRRGVAARGATLGTHRLPRRAVRDRRRGSRQGARDHRRVERSGEVDREPVGEAHACSTSVSVHEATDGVHRQRRARRWSRRRRSRCSPTATRPIATGYLRAAGIPQSSGAEFPSGEVRRDATAARAPPTPTC